MSSVNGMRVLVTGASSGLGAECSLAFASRGASVISVARRRSRLTQVERRIRSLGGRAVSIAADLTKVADIERTATIVGKEGGVDILINNAGIYLEDSPLIETKLSDWNQLINTNLRSSYLLCKYLVPGMVSRAYGRILNVTSATNHLAGVGVFRISKISLEVLTAVLAEELEGTGVTATALNPGWMRTETCCDGRSPRNVARVVIDLVERSPAFLNGTFIDLKWRGRIAQLCRRPQGRGRYGF